MWASPTHYQHQGSPNFVASGETGKRNPKQKMAAKPV